MKGLERMKKIEITARLPLLTDRLTNINADLAGMIGGGGVLRGRSKDEIAAARSEPRNDSNNKVHPHPSLF